MEGRSVNRRHSRANRLKVKVTYEEAARAARVWHLQGRHNRAKRWSKRSNVVDMIFKLLIFIQEGKTW